MIVIAEICLSITCINQTYGARKSMNNSLQEYDSEKPQKTKEWLNYQHNVIYLLGQSCRELYTN